MFKKKGLAGMLAFWIFLLFGGFLNQSCLAPYYYDTYHHRVWRDGHDDDWHKQHGDHWDEEHRDDRHHDDNR